MNIKDIKEVVRRGNVCDIKGNNIAITAPLKFDENDNLIVNDSLSEQIAMWLEIEGNEITDYVEPPKTDEQIRLENKAEKDRLLNELTVEVDGMIFDVRPSDLASLQLCSSIPGSHKWRLSNNTKAIVTDVQLAEVLAKGLALAIPIEDAYTDTLPDFIS